MDDLMGIRSIVAGCELAAVNRLAVETAFRNHPVVRYVRESPAEPSMLMYPAISDSYLSLSGVKKQNRGQRFNLIPWGEQNVYWTLPGQAKAGDQCGVVAASERHGSIPMTVCTVDYRHYARAISNHCWSMQCRNCMNSTAIRGGVRAENKIVAPGDIFTRKTGMVDELNHYVLSPPQEWTKRIMQNSRSFDAFYTDIIGIIQKNGIRGGIVVFHPWRLSDKYRKERGDDGCYRYDRASPVEDLPEWIDLEDPGETYWRLGPHFHIVGYGDYVSTKRFREVMSRIDAEYDIWGEDGVGESWVIKKIHPGEQIRSVRQTISYLLTHAGIGIYHCNPDWDAVGEDLIIPADVKGTTKVAKTESIADFYLRPPEQRLYRDGFTGFDFLDWTMKNLMGKFEVLRYFGSANRTRILADYSEVHRRRCPECESDLVHRDGLHDTDPEHVEYRRSSLIRVDRDDYDVVSETWYNSGFRDQGYTILDYAVSIPQCSTPETQGVQEFESNETVSQRADLRDRVLVYRPSRHGIGLDPVMLTRAEYAAMQGSEIIP